MGRVAGIIGGVGPESTIEYYRAMVAGYRAQVRDGSYPRLIINSIDMKNMLDLVAGNRPAEVTDYVGAEIQRLVAAGADFGLFACNTLHVVFDAIQERSPLPLISIVDVTCAAAQARGLKRVGLIGTTFTMQGRFYQDVFQRAGIAVVVPAGNEQAEIHDLYMNELVNGIVRPETHARVMEIVDRLREDEKIDGVILGGNRAVAVDPRGRPSRGPVPRHHQAPCRARRRRILA